MRIGTWEAVFFWGGGRWNFGSGLVAVAGVLSLLCTGDTTMLLVLLLRLRRDHLDCSTLVGFGNCVLGTYRYSIEYFRVGGSFNGLSCSSFFRHAMTRSRHVNPDTRTAVDPFLLSVAWLTSRISPSAITRLTHDHTNTKISWKIVG